MDDDCRRILSNLQEFLDGECAADVDRVVSQHLLDCAPCVDRAEFERELRALIATKCRDAAPAGLADRIVAGLRSSRL